MKKRTFILFFFLALASNYLHAQNPIPSLNIPVNVRANFQELKNGINYQMKNDRGRRILHVDAQHGSSILANCGQVWVYSLDGLDVIGPFPLCAGGSLSVEIDNRDWGALVESDAHLVVDVWIEEDAKKIGHHKL
jgi:hypothetical protein